MSDKQKRTGKKIGVSFKFHPDLLKKLKAASIKTGLSMTRLIERSITRELNLK